MSPKVWIWVWEIAKCERGDVAAIVRKAREHGVGVIVKTHDGLGHVPNFSAGYRLVSACAAAGVPVRAFGYVYPTVDHVGQAERAALALQAGAEAYVADAESEWEGLDDSARWYVDALRAANRGKSLAYSPMPVIDAHMSWPYVEFNALDLVLPQAYAGLGGRSAEDAFRWSEENWQRWGETWRGSGLAVPIVEWAVYAADQSEESVALALDAAVRSTVGNGAVSLWSWQHMTPEHWMAVRALAPTVERAYFSEEDRRRLVVIEQMLRGEADGLPAQTFAKVSAGFDNVPRVWLQRLFFRLNPWTGKPRARGERAPSEIRAREEGKDGR